MITDKELVELIANCRNNQNPGKLAQAIVRLADDCVESYSVGYKTALMVAARIVKDDPNSFPVTQAPISAINYLKECGEKLKSNDQTAS